MIKSTDESRLPYRMLLLLNVLHSAVLESPFHDIRLMRSPFNMVTLVKLGPEMVEVLELDQMPDIGEGSVDDGGFSDGSGSRDTGRHGLLNW